MSAAAPSPFLPSGEQFAWDSTSIKLAETCLYKYYLKMKCGWQPERKSAHLIFGGIYAKALEDYYKAIAEGVDREQAIRDVVHMALVETWEYPDCETCEGKGMESWGEPFDQTTAAVCPDCGGTGNGPGGQPWQSDHHLKTRGNLVRSIIWYFEQFKDDPCSTVMLSDGTPAVEHSFKLPVDDGIVLCGHLDRLVTYADALYVQDQKTTGTTISSRFFESFKPDTQMSLYTFAGKSIFNLPVKGVMIDGAQIAVGFTRFERGFTFRADDELNEWYDNSMYHIEAARHAAVENHFPMNPSSCGNYGGCEFRNICSKSPSVRQQFLKGSFVQGLVWNPLENR